MRRLTIAVTIVTHGNFHTFLIDEVFGVSLFWLGRASGTNWYFVIRYFELFCATPWADRTSWIAFLWTADAVYRPHLITKKQSLRFRNALFCHTNDWYNSQSVFTSEILYSAARTIHLKISTISHCSVQICSKQVRPRRPSVNKTRSQRIMLQIFSYGKRNHIWGSPLRIIC